MTMFSDVFAFAGTFLSVPATRALMPVPTAIAALTSDRQPSPATPADTPRQLPRLPSRPQR
jgi:hypothetical protein